MIERCPSLSIVIPTCNRPALLRQTLATITCGTLLPEEVIVVDQSRDPAETKRLAVLFGKPIAFHVIHLPVPSLTHARNEGLRKCSNDIVLFTDDDVLLGSDALERMLLLFTDRSVALVAAPDRRLQGATRRALPDIAGLIFARKKIKEPAGYMMKGAMLGRYPTDPLTLVPTEWAQGFFFALRRGIWQLSGLRFDENLPAYGYGEDLDFTRRFVAFARLRGMRAILDPAIHVEHLASSTGRMNNRRATSMYVLHRYYLSRKHFPMKHLYRLILVWSDVGELIRRLATRSGAIDLIVAYMYLFRHRSKAARGLLDES